MRRLSLAGAFCVLAVAGLADAQPVVYFSNPAAGQVLSIDGTSGGTPAVRLSASAVSTNPAVPVINGFVPEDMVVGPDGLLYICDVGNSVIWRWDPAAPSVAPEAIVYVYLYAPARVVPVGLTFSGSDDLYFNTRGGSGGGVWVVPKAAVPSGSPSYVAPPFKPSLVISAFSKAGQGTVVEAFGKLLIVDQAKNRVLVSDQHQNGSQFDYGPAASVLASGLSSPVGIATDTCGNMLVASGNSIQQFPLSKTYDPTTGRFTLSAGSPIAYATFGNKDVVQYFERDAMNNLYVATNSNGGGGKIWKVSPVVQAFDPISSCSAAAPPVSLLSAAASAAGGLAITPTTATSTRTFYPGSRSTAEYNFGHYTLTITYSRVYSAFTQTLAADMSQPGNVQFGQSTFAPGTVGMRFPSLGGFVSEFRQVSTTAVAGTSYDITVDPAFTIAVTFRDPLQAFTHPGLAHQPDAGAPDACSPSTSYCQDVTHDYFQLFDPAIGGGGKTWSKYVMFMQPAQVPAGFNPPYTVTLNQPALSNNPLYNIGQNVGVSLTVTDTLGRPVPGLVLFLSAARINPLPFVFEVVEATGNGAQGNALTDNGNGKYSIGVDSSFFTGGTGTYQFTVWGWGQGFSPYYFNLRFAKQ